MPWGSYPIISIPENLPHQCDLERIEVSADMYGGDVTNPVAVATNIRCFIQTASQREIDQFQKRGFDVSHRLYVSAANALLFAEDSICVNLRPLAQFPATLRLKVRSLADATVNVSPDLTKLMALAEFGGVIP